MQTVNLTLLWVELKTTVITMWCTVSNLALVIKKKVMFHYLPLNTFKEEFTQEWKYLENKDRQLRLITSSHQGLCVIVLLVCLWSVCIQSASPSMWINVNICTFGLSDRRFLFVPLIKSLENTLHSIKLTFIIGFIYSGKGFQLRTHSCFQDQC